MQELKRIAATQAGLAEIEEAIFCGQSVHATHVFTSSQLSGVRAAHRRGLARRLEAQLPVTDIACRAGLAIASMDAAIDPMLPAAAEHLRGQAGMAAARLAWLACQDDPKFAVFSAFGASPLGLEFDDLPMAELAQPADAHDAVLTQLARLGIDLETIGNDLLAKGLSELA